MLLPPSTAACHIVANPFVTPISQGLAVTTKLNIVKLGLFVGTFPPPNPYQSISDKYAPPTNTSHQYHIPSQFHLFRRGGHKYPAESLTQQRFLAANKQYHDVVQ